MVYYKFNFLVQFLFDTHRYIVIIKILEVTIIDNIFRQDDLGLIKRLPKSVLSKINISSVLLQQVQENIDVAIISSDSVENLSNFIISLGGTYQDLGYNFGVANIQPNRLVDLALNKNIQYIEIPKVMYISDAEGNRASCVPQARSAYNVEGEGVLVGFIDTGIDFTHRAFRNEDGSTRIMYIYDLSEGGKIYDSNIINQALNSEDPFSVVTSTDVAGHGTHVAGIACGGGKIDQMYYGVAPKSSIAMVKITRTEFALSTQIMRGLKFLVDKSKELGLPLVVNISLSTNDGAHNGSSLLEQYISTTAAIETITVVIAAGNEGAAAHHIGGIINEPNEVNINISADERRVVVNLYKSLLPRISLELVSPRGIGTGEIYISEGFLEGRIGDSIYQIFYTGPRPFDVSGEIGIVLTGVSEFITPGQWKITLRRTNEYLGAFDMWLPIAEGLNTGTRFLSPTINNTLGIPATVENVISVGSYNSTTNTISPFSGRGRVYLGQYIKPDVVAPGEGIYSAIPNGSFGRKSGTSMASPNVAGICALMMSWGIVKGNDPYFYGERLKYYLSIGAKRLRRDITYPDSAWGYGEVCVYESLNFTEQTLGSRNESTQVNIIQVNSKYNEYNIGKLFIRKPKEI